MAIVFITGSTDGLGRAAAQSLLDDGHKVVLHARSAERAATIAALVSRAAGVVVGDLGSAVDTRGIAEQVNAIGRMDAIIHNAGVYTQRSRGPTHEGHASTFAINTLAPYMLTALIERPVDWCISAAGCTAAERGRCLISTGQSGPGIRQKPTPKPSCTSLHLPLRWRDAGRRS